MKIAFIGQPEYFSFIYEKGLEKIGTVKDFPFNFRMDEKDYEPLLNYNADFNFFFRGEFVPNSVLLKLKGIKINLSSEPFPSYFKGKINYTHDSLNRLKYFMMIHDKEFDYIFHYDKSALNILNKFGFNISGDFIFPVRVYEQNRFLNEKWDLFFIGRSTKRREDYFSYLKHHYQFLHICHGIWGDDLSDYVQQSKIALNIHAENEISWEPRVQQMMSMGKMVISEVISPNDYLTPDKDYISIKTPEELIEKAEYYLRNEDERNRIAAHGQETVNSLLNNYKVFSSFINSIQIGKAERQEICFSKAKKIKFNIYYYILSTRIVALEMFNNMIKIWKAIYGIFK